MVHGTSQHIKIHKIVYLRQTSFSQKVVMTNSYRLSYVKCSLTSSYCILGTYSCTIIIFCLMLVDTMTF